MFYCHQKMEGGMALMAELRAHWFFAPTYAGVVGDVRDYLNA